MTGLAFTFPGTAPTVSPLARALAGAQGIDDLSLLGKLEVRRAVTRALTVSADVIPITSSRTLVVCPSKLRSELRRSLPGTVFDVTSALAGIAVEGDELLRRLTELDLDALPAAGKVAEVPALLSRRGNTFRIFFPQEYGDSVVEIVRDAQAGLG